MFATAMMQQQPPAFGHHHSSVAPAAAASALSSPFRPARPSPLSSSPLRAASPSATSWLSQQDTQSSPPQGGGAGAGASPSDPFASSVPPPRNLFRFAARPAKPVPRLPQNRDATRQTRRSLFLNNVRQRADDRAWNRRDCEQELQKLEWWSLERQIQAAREADTGAVLSEQDLEDAADWLVERNQAPLSPFPQRRGGRHHAEQNYYYDHAEDADMDDGDGNDDEQLMADQLAAEEEAELEALLASMAEAEAARAQAQAQGQGQGQQPTQAAASEPAPRPDSPAFSDDDSYDAIFAELVAGHKDTEMGLS